MNPIFGLQSCRYVRIALIAATLSAISLGFTHTRQTSSIARAADSAPPKETKLFSHPNLIAWCIVPFDVKKRSPEERAQMLARLGFTKFAYDYRAEHVPAFEAEIEALQQHHIQLAAWWFPEQLNDEARHILALLERYHLKTDLWVMGSGAPTNNHEEQTARIKSEATRIRPIAEAAATIGCRVGLYNHGGWFGEPENQIAIIRELNLPNVGIVYNLHHGHAHLDRFPNLLRQMLPHLYALNLNGMIRAGDKIGQHIVPLGQGDLDLDLLKTIRDSGYSGPVGILGHTQDDAEARLRDNLEGLAWLTKQLNGQPAGPQPTPRTYTPPKASTGNSPQKSATSAATSDAASSPNDDVQSAVQLAADALASGNAQRGLAIFCSAKFACLSCHQVGTTGGAVGPALTDVGRRLKPTEIAESLLFPKRHVRPEFIAWQLLLHDGRSLQVYKRGETADACVCCDTATQQVSTLAKTEIDIEQQIGTLMPDGLAAAMAPKQRNDLVRFLSELGHTPDLEKGVHAEDTIAEFKYTRTPLNPAAWPNWQLPVNRDRVYDFYTKEALFFRPQTCAPHLVPAYPGLDGGTFGHWGNQSDDTWRDDRWNHADLGSVLAGVFRDSDRVTPKGVCVRLGDHGELATCFNPETLTYDALWRGGFVKFSPVRHGFLDGLLPAGEMLPRPVGDPPTQPFVYHGFYRLGPRIVFSYRLGDVEMLDSPWVNKGKFERIVAPAADHPLRNVLAGGPTQWPQELSPGVELGTGQPYAVDTIKPPFDNPWKVPLFIGDHDFLPDGSALLCTVQGDVWRVSGLDEDLKNVRWRRFATGLHQPLGLVVAGRQVFVLGRDQITRLHDLNADGEADFYECFSNKYFTSPAGHDFTSGLARDRNGRFYTASGKQGLVRISADGNQAEVLATGLRNPDGVTLLPDCSITLPASEGEWTPTSMICLAKISGGDTQHSTLNSSPSTAPHFGYGGPLNGQPPSLPLVYLPRGLDNSSGAQAVVPDDRWGPLRGQLIHFSYGAGSHFLVLRDEVAGQPQGAVVPLVGDFRSGVHRGKFNPRDGQLYVSGLAGWGTYTPDDGCFQRVRYSGAPVQLPRSFHLHENGVLISFTQPIDAEQLTKPGNHFAQAWNYRYGPGYGSPEFAPSHPGIVGHEVLKISGIFPIDSTTVFVELPDLQPVNQLHLMLQVDANLPQELFVTVHRLDRPFTQFPGYQPNDKIIATHPQSIDLSLLGKSLPNPWRHKRQATTSLQVAAGKNLTFSTRTLRAKAGEALSLTFENPDVVPHNWVLLKPDSLSRVGTLANQLVADPEAVLHHYVPKCDDVLTYTDIVTPTERFTIYFNAPSEKGRYPYLCTFPGHWMVMNGELLVE